MSVSDSPAAALTQGGFRLGAVAMMDALGFRGIWKRVELEVLRDSLGRLVSKVRNDVDELLPMIGATNPVTELRFLSDTVVFTVAHDVPFSSDPLPVPPSKGEALVSVAPFSVEVAVAFASLLQARAALLPVPIAFRGVIAFGEFLVSENFLIGPAIDEAAQAHQRAKGALVWLLPSAEVALGRNSASRASSGVLATGVLRKFRVPGSGGAARLKSVVSPVALPGVPSDLDKRILATFGKPRPLSSVWWKRRTTAAFLAAAALPPPRGEEVA